MMKFYSPNDNSCCSKKNSGKSILFSDFKKNSKESKSLTFMSFLFFFFAFLTSSSIHAQFPGNDTTPGIGKTFNVPAGVTSVTAAVWGAGGGGGGSSANGTGGNGGGGGGATSLTFNVLSGQTITYTVGTGGTAGSAAGGAGGNGSLSSLSHAPSATALTGNPGTGGLGNAAALGAPANSGGGTALGGANSPGSNGTRIAASGGNGGNSGTALTIFGVGGVGNSNNNGAVGGPPGAGAAGGEYGGGSGKTGGIGANGQVTLQYISVSGITPNPVCVGSTITITGTNFAAGVSTVTINGTACTGVTRVNVTTITAVVAVGTTSGTVVVTNPNGTNNGQSITVTPLPAAIGGGAASVCTGSSTPAFTNAVAGGTWSVVNGTGAATISAGGVLTGTSAGTVTVNYTMGTCTPATYNVTVTTVTGIATTPSPANAATGVCYSGGGAVSSVSWTAVAGATSYDVYFGAGSLPGVVTSNVAVASYSTGALSASTTYYWKVVAKNGCGDAVGSTTWTFTTAAAPCALIYCAPLHTVSCSGIVSNVTFNTINNTSGCGNTGGTSYTNYAASGTPTTSLLIGFTYNLNITTDSSSIVSAWIDLNGNGVFQATEWTQVFTTGTNGNVNILIPGTATPGVSTIRIRSRAAGNPNGSGDPCTSFASGETEDYLITLVTPPACTTPVQPTALMLTPSGSSISGSFAPAVPSADNYLVVINTTGVAPTPVNGTTYTVGGTVGAGNTVVDIDTNTTFVATGLTPLTTYYIFIYSYNTMCTGGPIYNTVTPLNGSTTTTAADPAYCTPSVGAGYESLVYFSNISFVGTLNDTSNNSTFSAAPRGYQDFTTLANRSRQAQGEGVNISMQMSSRGYIKAWVDWNKDGDFLDAGETVYNTGGIATYSTTFGFIIPGAQALGNYRMRIRVNKDDNTAPYDPGAISTFDACQNINYYGETEDYTFTVIASCSAIITSVTDGETCGSGTVNLAATASGAPTQYRWYTTEFGGAPVGTTATGAWTTPALATTTTYWVTAFNGCESLVRTSVVARVNPVATVSFTPSVPEVCGENQVLSLSAFGDIQQTYLINEKFNAGLGVFTNSNIVSNGGAIDAISQWQRQASTFVPAQQVWFPAIASGLAGNGFAMATSDTGSAVTHNAIISPTVNTNTYQNLSLSFDIFYSRYYVDGANLTLDYVTVDVSTNGGGAWTEIDRYTADIGYGTRFVNKTYNLNAYINQPNFRVRIRYYGEWCDGLAIDNFQLFGNVPLNTAFNWTSALPVAAFQDAACTIPYVAGTPIVTVYIRPTLAQLEDTTYSFTATATLSNGCSVNQTVSINNKSKVWKGTNNDWNDPNNWSPVGVPDANTCVIIPSAANYSNISTAGYNAYGRTVQVKASGNLQVQSGTTLTVTDFVEVNATGTLNFENSASLIQVNNVANTGNITMKRNVNIRKLDYVYWSSPVANFSINSISPGTTGYKYKWTPTIGANINGWGNWVNANEVMVLGKGYIVRGPDAYTTALQNFTATHLGAPNNGNINMSISRGTYNLVDYSTGVSPTLATRDDDNWNLLGNPYPSSLHADDFLTLNTNIAGFIKLWSHGTLPSAVTADPFYENFVQNYTVADYVTYNLLGPVTPGFDGNIASGQGFFVLMNHTSAATTENVTFNNTMRSNAYRNDLFYRNNNSTSNLGSEKSRIWIDLVSPSQTASRTLIGYANEATNGLDRLYDAPALGVKSTFELFSLTDSDQHSIQGRSMPFDSNDVVPLGVSIPQNGNYTIAISSVDGLFSDAGQKIYLEDKLLNVVHNLKQAPYYFTGTTGTTIDRFELRYIDNTLSTNDYDYSSEVKIFANSSINVVSSNQSIKNVTVYDLLGKTLVEKTGINKQEIILNNLKPTSTVLIVKVVLENGATINKKVIY